MTKAEKRHLDSVANLGCIICESPCEIHHIRTGQGHKRATNFEVIPLCPTHHRNGGYGVAIHAGIKGFESSFGTELSLLSKTHERVGYIAEEPARTEW